MNPELKPNQVVVERNDDSTYFMPGRISRVIAPNLYEVITCGRHIKLYWGDQIEVSDYKGRWDNNYGVRERFPVFHWMPSLRQLKQLASRYDKTVWKRRRVHGSGFAHYSTMPPGQQPQEGRFSLIFSHGDRHWFHTNSVPYDEVMGWCEENGIFDQGNVGWIAVRGETNAAAFRLRWC